MKRGQRWLTHWCRRYFGASIADNGCRSGKIPTPGERGLSELLFLYLYTQDHCLGPQGLHILTPKVDLNKKHHLAHGYTQACLHFTSKYTGLHFQQGHVHIFLFAKGIVVHYPSCWKYTLDITGQNSWLYVVINYNLDWKIFIRLEHEKKR